MMFLLLCTETAITPRLHPRACSAEPAWPHLMTIHLPADTQSLSALFLSTLPYLLIPPLANTPICLQPTASTQVLDLLQLFPQETRPLGIGN